MNRILSIIHGKFKTNLLTKPEKTFDFDVPIDTDNYINYSFVNQHGIKKKILKELFSKFPPGYTRFIDGFCGSLAVSMYDNQAEEYHCNDADSDLVFLYNYIPNIKDSDLTQIQNELATTDKKDFQWYKENIKNLTGLEKFIGKIILRNYSLYSGEGTYRPCKNKDVYSVEIIKRIKFFQQKFKNKKFKFYNKDIFSFISDFDFQKNDFLYLDPPYFGTKQYSSNKSNKWTEKDLEELILIAKKTKIQFAISERLTEDIEEIAKKTGTKIVPIKKINHIKKRAVEILIVTK